MRRLLILLAIAGGLTGCANTLRVCDGKDRRPINTSAHTEAAYPSCGTAA